MVAPGVTSDIYAMVLATPIVIQQVLRWRTNREVVADIA